MPPGTGGGTLTGLPMQWRCDRSGGDLQPVLECALHSTAHRERRRDASDGAGSPWLVLVCEPDQCRTDQLGVERTYPQLAFGVRLVELAEPNRHVAADDDRTPASLDHGHLQAPCVARRRDKPEPGKQLKLAVDTGGRACGLVRGVEGKDGGGGRAGRATVDGELVGDLLDHPQAAAVFGRPRRRSGTRVLILPGRG